MSNTAYAPRDLHRIYQSALEDIELAQGRRSRPDTYYKHRCMWNELTDMEQTPFYMEATRRRMKDIPRSQGATAEEIEAAIIYTAEHPGLHSRYLIDGWVGIDEKERSRYMERAAQRWRVKAS